MKFEHFEMFDDAAKMYDMYGYMFHEVHEDDPPPEEAVAILYALTPDDLKWSLRKKPMLEQYH